MRKKYPAVILFGLVFLQILFPQASLALPPADGETATYYIVIADTGRDYYKLRQSMERIGTSLNIPIDMMGRSYNTSKNLIALPDDDEDEIYAGDYYPRRVPSEFLSLEYLDFYLPKTKPNTIVLVAGIYEKREQANRMLKKIKKKAPKAYVLKANVFVGCMH